MKIGLVRRGFSATGGAEAYLLRLAGGLARAGHEPVLVTSGDWPADRWPHGEIIRLEGRTPQKFADNAAAANLDLDVTFSLDRVPGCQIHRAGDGVHAAWLHRRARFEPLWKKYLNLMNPKHLSMMRLEVEVYQTARRVVANSHMVADEIRRWHDFPKDRIHVVPNGIGQPLPSLPRKEARRKLELPPDAFCILFVGTGWERKGLKFALRAVESLGAKALLLVAGRGPAQRYRSDKARFLGPLSDLSTLFSAADVFTLPTIYDPFSNACLEALAAGLPVVTTKANGFSEIITDKVHGGIVEAGDAAALASALEWWEDYNVDETRAACRLLASEYSIERNVQSTLDVILAPGEE